MKPKIRTADPGAWPLGMSCSVNFPYAWETLKRAGLDDIELTWHPLDIRQTDVQAKCELAIRRVRALGLHVRSVHIPYGPDYDPSLLDAEARSQAIANIRRVLALAGDWGVGIAVLHPSFEPIPPEEREERLRTAGDTLALLAAEAETLGVKLAAECLPRTCLGNTAREIRYLIDRCPQLGVCCDVNHLMQENPEDFIRAIGPRIVATHISDNDGLDEKHWMPGDGVLDWPAIIGALADTGYDGAFVYEVRVKPPFVVAENWRMLLADCGMGDRRGSGAAKAESAPSAADAGNAADRVMAGDEADAGDAGNASAANAFSATRAASAFTPDAPIAVTDQASGRILVLDPACPDWSDPNALLWSWQPSEANGFGAAEMAGWGLPSDVKLRRTRSLAGGKLPGDVKLRHNRALERQGLCGDVELRHNRALTGRELPGDAKLRHTPTPGGQRLIACDSNGLAVIASYPTGLRLWSCRVGGNPHAVELLPDGNIAIAASHGGWVRVYASSVSADADTYAQFELAGAHGLLWDDECQCLWAVGDHVLTAIEVAGSPDAPILRESSRGSLRLPTESGHDLFPVGGAPNRLWVTTHAGVYQYDKQAHTWIEAGVDRTGSQRAFVKSIGNQPSGQRVYTIPDSKRPSPAAGLYDWTTNTVQFSEPDGVRTIAGAAIYKARIWRSFA